MNSLKALVISAILILAGCEYTPTNPVTKSNNELDLPCVTSQDIFVSQHLIEGNVSVFFNNESVSIRFNQLPENTNIIHIKVTNQTLTGNLSPGQFPIHINNPVTDTTYNFLLSDLNLNESCQHYFYIHLETDHGTGWAGENTRQGRGQWYNWIYLNCCN